MGPATFIHLGGYHFSLYRMGGVSVVGRLFRFPKNERRTFRDKERRGTWDTRFRDSRANSPWQVSQETSLPTRYTLHKKSGHGTSSPVLRAKGAWAPAGLNLLYRGSPKTVRLSHRDRRVAPENTNQNVEHTHTQSLSWALHFTLNALDKRSAEVSVFLAGCATWRFAAHNSGVVST